MNRYVSAIKAVVYKNNEATHTWTSPPTPPTIGSSSRTFTISTDEAGSSMVSESHTCKGESQKLREEEHDWLALSHRGASVLYS